MSRLSRIPSQRSVNLNEQEELAVNVVIVTQRDKSDDRNAATYRILPGDTSHDDAIPLSSNSMDKVVHFVAMLAPTCQAAIAFLQMQPPGSYLLALEEDATLIVYMKFRQAMRVSRLVKGKTIKKNDGAIEFATIPKNERMGSTRVHTLRLPSDVYFYVKECWQHFLPQVQSIVLEACCEPSWNETIKLEEWTLAPSSYAVGLIPETSVCYILASANHGHASTSSSIQVRQIEFDFDKLVVTIVDGVLKPSALLLTKSFGSKHVVEPHCTFPVLRDNFLTPDLVALKEMLVDSVPARHVSFQNYMDLSSNDRELAVLHAFVAVCDDLLPHSPLPDEFVASLHELHCVFVHLATRDLSTSLQKSTLWSAPKMTLIGRIIPVLMELLVITATFSETIRRPNSDVFPTTAVESKQRQNMAQFAHAMRFHLLFMAARSDDSICCRLVHQVCQLIGNSPRLPSVLVDLVRDLVVLFPSLERLFVRNQGIELLWRAVHHEIEENDAEVVSNSQRKSISLSSTSLTLSVVVLNALRSKGKRKIPFLSLGRKSQTMSHNTLPLGTTRRTCLRSTAFAYRHLSFSTVQASLSTHLKEGAFVVPNVWKADSRLATTKFCSCRRRQGAASEEHVLCAHKPTVKASTSALLLQLLLRLLYHKSTFGSWDRDVALLIRMHSLHRDLFDQIVSIVRRQADTQDGNAQTALCCELQVAITCVSTLYQLERKRRYHMSTSLGEKKYLQFIRLFKTTLRQLNERVQSSDDDTEEREDNEEEARVNEEQYLNAFVQVFRRIPRAFLDEWIVFSLKEILQTIKEVSNVIKKGFEKQQHKQHYVQCLSPLFRLLTVVLKRTSDPDLQTMLVHVLGDCSAMLLLVRFVLSGTSLLVVLTTCELLGIQMHTLDFLTAFVNLNVSLRMQNHGNRKDKVAREEAPLNEDAEVIEHLKGELLIRLVGPRMVIEDAEAIDQSLWDLILEFMGQGKKTTSSPAPMLSILLSFHSTSTLPLFLTNTSREHFLVEEAFVLLQQALYSAQVANFPIDYAFSIANHLRLIEQYSDRMIMNEAIEEQDMVCRLVELNLQCLIVLASQRSLIPAIQDAFDHVCVLPVIVSRLEPCHRPLPSEQNSSTSLEALFNVPALNFPQSPSRNSSKAVESNKKAHTYIVHDPRLHVHALVFVMTYVLVDPTLEIDETLCPRMSVPGQTEGNTPNELLWTLQQHLASVNMDQRHFEVLAVEMQPFVSISRFSAIRTLLRLLGPNSTFAPKEESKRARDYIARGAFSTVYRQYPTCSLSPSLAVKLVEHQRRAGDLCAVSALFNEIRILSKLQGNAAATQLVDFTNQNANRNFEIVMEDCPCSLTEWRATLNRSDMELSFRSCLVLLLRVFEQVCEGLTRIHRAGVCHFDIKGDNILACTSANFFSCKLLEIKHDQKMDDKALKHWLCFADFGESKVIQKLPPVDVENQVETFISLTRTRGTEAIKSPEVLRITGSEMHENVTLASDIWSLGCLLYELITQELLFQTDDWACLYAHLIVRQDHEVLRVEHKQKIIEALRPSNSNEQAVVTGVTELCRFILTRDPTKRPKLEMIATRIRQLLAQVDALPLTTSDDNLLKKLAEFDQEPSRTASPPLLRPVFPSNEPFHPESPSVTVPVRLFWNFFLAADVTRSSGLQTVTSCLGKSCGLATNEVLAMNIFEERYETQFTHFVYINWHAFGEEAGAFSTSRPLIEKLHEDDHRTCFVLNRQSFNSRDELVQQLVGTASRYFPVLQRRLRDDAGCVMFIPLGNEQDDMHELQQFLSAMLLYFLRRALAMSPLHVLSCFNRECAQFFDDPGPECLQHVMPFSTPLVEGFTLVQCHCGASVFTVDVTALIKARTSQICTCDDSLCQCLCFHPFPMDNDEVQTFVYDENHEQFVLPMEVRARQRDEVQWLVVDTKDIRRVWNEETSMENLLLNGLKCRGQVQSWDLYECELCRLPICALCQNQVAVPMLHTRS